MNERSRTWTGAISAAVVLAAASAGREWSRVRRAERRFPPPGKFVRVDEVRLHYLLRGSGDPVVLLHGNPGFVQDYSLTILDALAAEFTACAIDRPGHGYSTRPWRSDLTAEGQARLVHGVLEALDIHRPVLVGHSWSGALVLAYAIAYPDDVAGIVLLGAMTHPVPPSSPGRAALLASPILGHLVRWTVWPWRARSDARANVRAAYAPDPIREDHAAVAEALWSRPGQIGAVAQDQLTVAASLARQSRKMGLIRVPVTIVYGDEDPWCAPELHVEPLLRSVPHATVVRLERTGHELAHTRGDAVIEAVRATWRQARAGGRPSGPTEGAMDHGGERQVVVG